jgi:hypothetical protein
LKVPGQISFRLREVIAREIHRGGEVAAPGSLM